MESGSHVHGRRIGAVAGLMGLLLGLTTFLPGSARAEETDPGADIGGFEIDGQEIDNPDFPGPGEPEKLLLPAANFAFDDTGDLDWGSIPDLGQYLHFDDPYLEGDDGSDLGFAGGTKEFEPDKWSCAADSGDDPQKDDLHYMLAYPSVSIDNAVVAFAYVREKPEGNTNVVIEFNRSSLDSCNKAAGRSVGDVILHFDFPGGDDPAGLDAYVWNGSAMVPFAVPAGVAHAATNDEDLPVPPGIEDAITDNGLSDTVLAREMGEAAIDLAALRDALQDDPDIGDQIPDDILECPGIGYANIRTRSSGSSTTSQLHDSFPQIPINLSNCGSLDLKKVDDLGAPMDGVQFGLFDTLSHAEAGTPVAQLPTDPPEDLACETDEDGICSFVRVPPGTYYINELNLSDDYAPDPDLPQEVTVGAFEHVDLGDDDNGACATNVSADGCEWFVNTLKTGGVVINKQVVDAAGEPVELDDVTYLDGITFELQDGGIAVQKRDGGDATCTLELDDPADDPSCTITGVPLGTYDVVEDPDSLPPGLSAGPPLTVTMDEVSPATAAVTYENPLNPIGINLDKTGDALAHVGDTVDYDFTVINDGGVDLVAVELTDPDCDAGTISQVDDGDGDDVLAVGEAWSYTCRRTIGDDDVVVVDGRNVALNTGTVAAEDVTGRPVDDTDPHEVLIITPAIEIVKTVDDDTPAVDQTVTFTYVVTNGGDTTLFGVDVDDDKLGPIGTIDELAAGDSATLTKTMVVATDSPTRNVATADGEDILGEHVVDDDDAIITVVQGVVIVAPELPRTGSDVERLLTVAGALVVLGGVALASGRPARARARARRRPQQ